MDMRTPRQITRHQIDDHGRQHHDHAKPDAPVTMGMSPIRRIAVFWIFPVLASALMVAEFYFFHCFSAFSLSAPHSEQLGFAQPLPRLGALGVIEIADLRLREWFAKSRHAVLPFLVSNHGEPFDVGEVF